MKRTLCLVLSMLLLVGLLAPAAEAYSDERTPIIIRCPNWSSDIPVSDFRFEFKSSDYSLAYRPLFYYENERGEQVEETGKLRDIPYTLVLYLDCRINPPQESIFNIWVNGVRANSYFVYPPNTPWDCFDGDIVAYFDVGPHTSVSDANIFMWELKEGGYVFQLPRPINGLNIDFDVFDGPTPDCPLISTDPGNSDIKLEAEKSYLYRFYITRSGLNVELENPLNITVSKPLVHCPEFTAPYLEEHPDALIVYARYDCPKTRHITMKATEKVQGMVKFPDPETGGFDCHYEYDAAPGASIHVDCDEYSTWDFHHWDAVGIELTEEQKYAKAFDFIMPDRDITLTPAVVPAYYRKWFTDVAEDDWFYDEVQGAVYYKMVNGVSDYEFDPYGVLKI